MLGHNSDLGCLNVSHAESGREASQNLSIPLKRGEGGIYPVLRGDGC